MPDSVDEEITDLEAANLVKKKNVKSIVWNYFGLKADGNGTVLKEYDNRPACHTCNKSVLCKNVNTSNLFSHLRDHHPTQFKEACKVNGALSTITSNTGMVSTSTATQKHQKSFPDSIERRKCYPLNSLQAIELNAAVAYYLAKDMQPYNTVERPGF